MSSEDEFWQKISLANLPLIPFSLIFLLLSVLRRLLYRCGLLRSKRLPVPVVVIGNLTVGGTGKTPLVIWLAKKLIAAGRHPGIVSRGYGGTAISPQPVMPGYEAAYCGDEPLLLARCGAPVWIGKDKAEVARALLAHHPECDILILDDGLQHYGIARDFEVAVIDGERLFGNRLPLPAGPLRELPYRLKKVDAIVVNTNSGEEIPRFSSPAPVFNMRLVGGEFYNLRYPDRRRTAADFAGKKVYAVAGIGNPERFFRALADLGITSENYPFPDHHFFQPHELIFGSYNNVIMTEKDAVKCERWAQEDYWIYPVEAEIPEGFFALILERTLDGRKAA